MSAASTNHPDPQIPDYELVKLIGQGAYGEVWLARTVTGSHRAVKIVGHEHSPLSVSADPDEETSASERERSRRAFEREFEGIRKFEALSHSHSLVRVLHIGQDEGACCFYYVMELADSRDGSPTVDPATYKPLTLAAQLRKQGRLTLPQCQQLGLVLADALRQLHAAGLIHRDIKPDNLIYAGGIPKVADIGLVTDASATMTFVGTPGFIPPEGPGQPAADIFAAGKVLYEAATGNNCRDYPALPDCLGAFEQEERRQFLDFKVVWEKASAMDVRNRYPSAEAMERDLRLLSLGVSLHQKQINKGRLQFAAMVAALIVAVAAAWLLFPRTELRETKRVAAPDGFAWHSEMWLGTLKKDGPQVLFIRPPGGAIGVVSAEGTLLHTIQLPGVARQDLALNRVTDFDDDGMANLFVSWNEWDGQSNRMHAGFLALEREFRLLRHFSAEGKGRVLDFNDPTTGEAKSKLELTTLSGELIDGDRPSGRQFLAFSGANYVLGGGTRGLYAFDYYNTNLVRWFFPLPSGPSVIQSLDLDEDGLPDYVFGTYSTANGYIQHDVENQFSYTNHGSFTDDSHSYIYGVSHDGKLLFRHELGDSYSKVIALPVTTRHDGVERVELFATATAMADHRKDRNPSEFGTVFKFSHTGEFLRKRELGSYIRSIAVVDLAQDGRRGLLATDASGKLRLLTLDLEDSQTVQVTPPRSWFIELEIVGVADLLSSGRKQIVLRSCHKQHVSGDNPGIPGKPTNEYLFHDAAIHVFDHQLREIATWPMDKVQTNQTHAVIVGRFDERSRQQIMVASNPARLLELRRVNRWGR